MLKIHCFLDVSQETDSDAESLMSDTKTILSPGESWPDQRAHHRLGNGRLPGDTQSVCSLSSRTVSDSSDSHHSDVEVCILRTGELDGNCKKYCLQVERSRKIYNRALMSMSICADNRDHQSKTKLENKKMLELRSFSTPNFKNLEAAESASPYFSLEMLDCDNTDTDSDTEGQHDSSDSSISIKNSTFPSKEKDSSSSTDTSSGVQMFRKPKIIKRPSNRQMCNRLKSCLIRDEPAANQQRSASSHSKHRETVLASIQPQGFDRK